ncbi:hypothetical protein AB1K70_24855 [Bremerella sp. JC770]|uniref:hypothetical protein n=1 Tax=Bremerella sp. JC770 TaxID=3232137 RepID=UPI0034579397
MSTINDTRELGPESGRNSSLRTSMAAVRVRFSWFGVRKSLSPEQKSRAADSFGAEGKFLSAGKRLFDTTHPAFKAVTTVRSRVVSYWKGVSLPYPEPGIRLIRQDAIEAFDKQMIEFRAELQESVEKLERQYGELRRSARARLGDLYCEADYPATLGSQFGIEHEFVSVEPPEYLQQLNPTLYEAECRRMQARFEEAAEMAEQAFTEELSKLVDHLAERLAGNDDGRPKIFRDSAVENLGTFFSRFRDLSIGSNQELEDLVARAEHVVRGIEPQQLRKDSTMRERVASQLSAVQAKLDGMLVERPRRNILRRHR